MDIELVKEITKEHFHEAVQLRRHLHQHPELSFAETETTALILKELQGIDVMSLTPMDAMNRLFLLREKARKL